MCAQRVSGTIMRGHLRPGWLLLLPPLVMACKSVTLPAAGPKSLDEYVPRGKVGLVPFAQRRAGVQANPEAAQQLCSHRSPRVMTPIRQEVVGHGSLYGIYNHPNPFNHIWLHTDDSIAG
ncbi:MAG: hypothetical protein DWQ09_09320 [Proteobacteria bacterium]|nr:MAG: hypothetical protein DWQ09_09320 [Pseudomonadota bacterium]